MPARGNDRCSTGRRGIDTETARIRETLRAPQRRQLPLVEEAMGRQALPLLGWLHATCAAADDLEQATIESLTSSPPPPAGTCVLGHVSGTVIWPAGWEAWMHAGRWGSGAQGEMIQ